jgi:RNA polymerase sigma factor (sigma-70 family)
VTDKILTTIRQGNFGALERLVREVARKLVSSGRTISIGNQGTSNAIDELVQEFFLLPVRIAVESATDDDSLRAYIYTMLDNHLINEYRRTERGRLHVRAKKILQEGGFIEDPKNYWRRSSDPASVFEGSEASLVAACQHVEVNVVTWSSSAKRNSPSASRECFLKLLSSIFDCAAGAVNESTLINVLAGRLGLLPMPFAELLDIADPSPDPEEQLILDELDDEVSVLIHDLWRQLSPDERRILPSIGSSSRLAATQLGIGRTKANQVQARLKAKLRVLLSDTLDKERSSVLAGLVQLSNSADK